MKLPATPKVGVFRRAAGAFFYMQKSISWQATQNVALTND